MLETSTSVCRFWKLLACGQRVTGAQVAARWKRGGTGWLANVMGQPVGGQGRRSTGGQPAGPPLASIPLARTGFTYIGHRGQGEVWGLAKKGEAV